MLGWNTADDAQYGRLKSYVEGGGTLFLSLPHLTRNEEREFLWNGLEPLNLIRDGDYTDLFGVRVAGRGPAVGNVVAESGTRDNPLAGYAQSASFFRLPPVPPLHDPRLSRGGHAGRSGGAGSRRADRQARAGPGGGWARA